MMAVIRTRQTRMPHGVRDARPSLAKSADATLSETEVLQYNAVTQSGTGKKVTLPAAAATYKGASLIIASIHANSTTNKVFVTAGFSGGGTSYDTATIPALGALFLYCDGTYWYIVGASPAGS